MDAPMAIEPVHHLARLGGLEIHVAEWGAGNPRTLVAFHGLARTGADFAPLAQALGEGWRILAPDAPGRGLSAWAGNPSDYGFALYERMALDLVEGFVEGPLDWIGTSMGGGLGIRLAAGPLRSRIGRLIVNDIGPEIPSAAVERILSYVGSPPDFASIVELEAWLRRVYAPYGYLPDEEWRAMALTSWRRRDDGRITVHYDPAIVRQFQDHDDYPLWDAWDALRCPVLVLRGAQSDLLSAELARTMVRRNPHASVREIEGCGHAPPLNRPEQAGLVSAFLEGGLNSPER
jgi:pimeloyl-ACP methyl ester carboxylesterase